MVHTSESKLYSVSVMGASIYVRARTVEGVSSGKTKARKDRSDRSICWLDVPADGTGRFLLGPLQSGVLQQVMHTELSLPVQNCW